MCRSFSSAVGLGSCALVLTATLACFDEPRFDAPAETSGEIFFDGFPEGLDFQAFAGTNQANPAANALAIDSVEFFSGRSSLRFIVPGLGDPSGAFAGGALVAAAPRDLSQFNALTFMAKGSRQATMNVAGFGNDNTGTSRLTVERSDIPLTGDWTKVVVPIPDPEQLTSERGLFHFAEGADGEPPTGYTFWLDELQFVRLEDQELGTIVPSIDATALAIDVDSTATISATQARFSARPENEVLGVAPGWFDFSSDDAAIASVNADGVVVGVAAGATTIRALLAGVDAGSVDVDVAVAVRPVDLPPTPTTPAVDVVALFSDAYASAPVDTFRADWSSCGEVKDVAVAGESVKSYAALEFAGIEFISTPLDLSSYRTVHLDIWTPDSAVLKVKLVDFGADGVFGNDDREHELTFSSSSSPALTQNAWVSLDLPLSSFVGLTRRQTVTQLILSASTSTVFVDNIYFAR